MHDRQGDQRAVLHRFMGVLEDGAIAGLDAALAQEGSIRVLRMGGDIFENEISLYLREDVALSLVSFAFVLACMLLHSRSVAVTVFGVLGMGLSFPPAMLMLKHTLGPAFNMMMVVSIWVIMGIGCDDIFIFVDTWRRSKHVCGAVEGKTGLEMTLRSQAPIVEEVDRTSDDLVDRTSEDLVDLDLSDGVDGDVSVPRERTHTRDEQLVRRLQWTFRHAGGAMLVTSVTTATAFLATATSRIFPLRQFGFFMAALVTFNYVLVMTVFALGVVVDAKVHAYSCNHTLPTMLLQTRALTLKHTAVRLFGLRLLQSAGWHQPMLSAAG
jgi:predicted RND superfamily exporter protein